MIQTTLHQLKVFETAARYRSFTRAAEAFLITQPTVSSQMKQLAQAVGLPLFEQVGKQIYLTKAGQELFTVCQEVFNKLDRLEMKLADWKSKKQGCLKVAAIATANFWVPPLLVAFCQQYPQITVSLQVNNHQQIHQRMRDNKDDLYILSQLPEDLDLCTEPFFEHFLFVVAPINHPLAGQPHLPIQALNGQALIMREPGSGTRTVVQRLLAQHQVSVKTKLELSSNEEIKEAIAAGLGISVLSHHALSKTIAGLTILDVQHFPIQQSWYVAHLAGKQLSVIAQTFREYLLNNRHFVGAECVAPDLTNLRVSSASSIS